MTNPVLRAKIINKWCEILANPETRQCYYSLFESNNACCTLGAWWLAFKKVVNPSDDADFPNSIAIPPKLWDDYGPKIYQHELIILNDIKRLPFSEISTSIRQHPNVVKIFQEAEEFNVSK